MERMGDILARTARGHVRRGRLGAARAQQAAQPLTQALTQAASSATPTQPTQPVAEPRPAAPATRPLAASPFVRRTPRAATPPATPTPDVAHRAIPPADALDALESERILEMPSQRGLPAPRAARATAPLATPATPAYAQPYAPATMSSAEPPAQPPLRTQRTQRSRQTPAHSADASVSQMSAGSSGMLSLGEAAKSYTRAIRPSREAGREMGREAAMARRSGASSRPTSDDPDVCPLCHGAGYVRLDVSVGDPAFGQAVACSCKERLLEDRRLSDLRRMSSLDAFRDKTFATFDDSLPGMREALEVARRYAEDPHGWLVLSGGYGVGKTHLAAAIAHERLASGQSVFFRIVPDLLDHLRAAFAPSSETPYDELFDKVREAGVLVLDDLGAENATAWATEKLFQIINYRYNYRMPTVVTTNNRLLSHMDERIRSRLSDRSFVRNVAIESGDYRERHAGRPRATSQRTTPRTTRGAYQR